MTCLLPRDSNPACERREQKCEHSCATCDGMSNEAVPQTIEHVVSQADPARVELIGHFLIRDRVIESVMTRLAVEAKRGSPLGNLYAESACEFLAHHIVCSYSSLSGHRSPVRGGLTGRRLKIALDYIHDSLGQRITPELT